MFHFKFVISLLNINLTHNNFFSLIKIYNNVNSLFKFLEWRQQIELNVKYSALIKITFKFKVFFFSFQWASKDIWLQSISYPFYKKFFQLYFKYFSLQNHFIIKKKKNNNIFKHKYIFKVFRNYY